MFTTLPSPSSQDELSFEIKWLLEDSHPSLTHWHPPVTTQHSDLLPARLSSPGSGEGDPGAPETSSSFQCWGRGGWPGTCLQRAWPVHPQLNWEDGPLQPPRSDYGQDRRGGPRRHPPAQGQRPVPDSTHYPGRGGSGKEGFTSRWIYVMWQKDVEGN